VSEHITPGSYYEFGGKRWVLADDFVELGKYSRELIDEITRLRARIAELEELVTLNQVRRLDRRHEHIITEEQIDMAWEKLNRDIYRAVVKTYFAKLGIVACSECGGSRIIGRATPHPCDCTGCHRNGKSHGWVWAIDGLSTPIDGGGDE
jgi:hypothetical protein